MNFKKLITAGIMALAALAALADPTVTDVVAKQRYPWNGLVDITCKVTGISGTDQWKFSVAAVMPDTGEARKVSQFWVVRNGTNSTDRTVSVNGTYKLLWDAKADLGQVSYDNMVMRPLSMPALGECWPRVKMDFRASRQDGLRHGLKFIKTNFPLPGKCCG